MKGDDLIRLLAAKFAEMQRESDAKFAEMQRESAATSDAKFQEMQRQSDAKFQDMLRHLDAKTDEIKRHVDARFAALDGRFGLMAEALAHVDHKIDVKAGDLEERMERGFSDVEAAIRFSHAHLMLRIERLEASGAG